jgi:hypothetical protein
VAKQEEEKDDKLINTATTTTSESAKVKPVDDRVIVVRIRCTICPSTLADIDSVMTIGTWISDNNNDK